MSLVKVNLVSLVLGFALGWALNGLVMAVLFGVLAVLIVLIWHKSASDIVLSGMKAVQLTEASAVNPIQRRFLADAYALASAAKLPRMRFSIIDTHAPLAFSLGSAKSGGRIVVTSGLFKTLTRLEVAAVVGHELGHIKANERVLTAMGLSLSRVLSMIGIRGGNRHHDVRSRLAQHLLKPECRADAFSAELCKDSAVLASALKKLERGVRASHWQAVRQFPFIGHVAIVNPVTTRAGHEHAEYSSMAYRVAELHRLAVARPA